MTICVCSKDNSTISLNQYIDHNRHDIIFYVVLAIRSSDDFSAPGVYKEYNFKSFKAAYNKYDSLCVKYNLYK